MFEWITKPYIEWNFIDTVLSTIEIALTGITVFIISLFLLELKDKLKEKLNRKKNNI